MFALTVRQLSVTGALVFLHRLAHQKVSDLVTVTPQITVIVLSRALLGNLCPERTWSIDMMKLVVG